jgi:hypothetical protein
MKIKFSHKYSKLKNAGGHPITSAKLLDVIVLQIESLSKHFLSYDTDNGLFVLPRHGKYMMLIFQKPFGCDLFTTIRRWTEEKERYYRSGIGEWLEVGYATERIEQ